LYDISYANIILYSSVIPSYGGKDKEEGGNEEINADDPANADKINAAIFG
jgi:hypothetical protein